MTGLTTGALNLYPLREDAFDEMARIEALALAAHVAVALAAAQEIGQLRVAIESRTVIGQAEGILMERFGLSARQAFSTLVRVSSVTNRKLSAIAAELVASRQLPTVPGSRSPDQDVCKSAGQPVRDVQPSTSAGVAS